MWNVCYLATGFLVSLFWPSGDAVKKCHCGDSKHKRRPIQPQINPVKQGNVATRRGKTLEMLVEVWQPKSLLQITPPLKTPFILGASSHFFKRLKMRLEPKLRRTSVTDTMVQSFTADRQSMFTHITIYDCTCRHKLSLSLTKSLRKQAALVYNLCSCCFHILHGRNNPVASYTG